MDRAKLAKSVAKADDVLAKVVEDFRAAAAKFDAGRKIGKNAVVSKYLELKSEAYENRADAEETRRKAIALLLDKSIHTKEELHQKREAADNEAAMSEGEFERLDNEAQNLHDDNSGKFK